MFGIALRFAVSTPASSSLPRFEIGEGRMAASPEPKRRRTRRYVLRRPTPKLRLLLLVCLGCLLIGIIRLLRGGRRAKAAEEDVSLSELGVIGLPLDEPAAQHCNPFHTLGILYTDSGHAEENLWQPFDKSCPPSTLMAGVMADDDETMNAPWLRGKTVLMFGDSIDRHFLMNFCKFAAGEREDIGTWHHWSPANFTDGVQENLWNATAEQYWQSRPEVCHIARNDLMIIFVFHYGVMRKSDMLDAGPGEKPVWQEHNWYPPGLLKDRISHVVLPLLAKIGRQPDLIEFASGYWDVRQMKRQKPHDEDAAPGLEPEQVDWYSRGLASALRNLHAQLPNIPILFRHMHVASANYWGFTSPIRTEQMNQIAHWVIQNFNHNAGRTVVRNNEWNILIRGHEGSFLDGLHPAALPSYYLRSDILLYELKRLHDEGLSRSKDDL